MKSNHYRRVAISLSVACFLGGCSGTSPTDPGGSSATPASGLTISFSDAAGQLATREDEISDHIEASWQRSAIDLAVDGLAIEVIPGPRLIIPDWGVGGRAPNGFEVEIAVEPTLPAGTVADRLPSMVAHELHHAARHRGPGYGRTLLEAMVSEGLADHYAREVYDQPLPPWATALSGTEIDVWLDRARSELDSASYSHSAWFFGTNGEIPRWVGYTLGFQLVSDYLAAHPGTSAASLVNLQAEAFRPSG